MNNEQRDSLSRDTIPLDVDACIEQLIAIARQSDPTQLAKEDYRDQMLERIEAFRQDIQQTIVPHAKPTRVACKRCYFRMRHGLSMWRDFYLLGLVRRQCGAIAFVSDVTIWDEMETRIKELSGRENK